MKTDPMLSFTCCCGYHVTGPRSMVERVSASHKLTFCQGPPLGRWRRAWRELWR